MTGDNGRWFGWWAEEYDASLPSFPHYSTGSYTPAQKQFVRERLREGFPQPQTRRTVFERLTKKEP